MNKSEYHIIGVMSGTSLDGIDLVYASFRFHTSWCFEIKYAQTVPYSKHWQHTLKNLVHCSPAQLQNIDNDYTIYLAEVINRFMASINYKFLDAICSHGHTALHQPENKLTYQIGNKPMLSTLTNSCVVCDFRVQDVELGGQGAPLVPIGDRLLFSNYDFCLNLGGFANISTEIAGQRMAYDMCPVNIVLNFYVGKLGLNYDDEGKIASKGNVNNQLLNELNNLSFYKKSPPKSLGLEWVQAHIFPLINSYNLNTNDVLRTFVEHISIQITTEINQKRKASVLITGGGAYHTFLIDRIKAHSNQTLIIPEKEVIEYKEALIFGFLGVLKLRGEVNCLKTVTGAKTDHSSGKLYLPLKNKKK